MVSTQYCGIKRFRHTHRAHTISSQRSPFVQYFVDIYNNHMYPHNPHTHTYTHMLGSFNYQYIITATGRPAANSQQSMQTNQRTNECWWTESSRATLSCAECNVWWQLIFIFEFTCVIINMKNLYNKTNGRHRVCYSFAHSCIQMKFTVSTVAFSVFIFDLDFCFFVFVRSVFI